VDVDVKLVRSDSFMKKNSQKETKDKVVKKVILPKLAIKNDR
jgi:hypothetical protein